jgi:hypothetical protein
VLMLRAQECGSSIRSTRTVSPAFHRLILFAAVAAWAMFGADLRPAAGDDGTTPAVRQASVEKAAAPTTNEAWRFKYHAGRWWYWLPTNSWAWHDGQRWIDYQPGKPQRIGATLVQQQVRRGEGERYGSGTSPAPPETLEQLQSDVEELQQRVQQLQSRLAENQQASGNGSREGGAAETLSDVDQARLRFLWQERQNVANFYNFGTDEYYFAGKGHFTD